MKNKIILTIFTILLTVNCGNKVTNGRGVGTISDNKETPQTDSEISKNFLDESIKKAVSYKGELIEFYDRETTYTFDANANLTKITYLYNDKVREENKTYKFWGMSSDNYETAYYYSEYNSSGIIYYELYTGLIFNNGAIVINNEQNLRDKMQADMLERYTKTFYDNSKIKPEETSTSEASEWKNKVANKKKIGSYNGDASAIFTFDANGNLTINFNFYSEHDSEGNPIGSPIPSKTDLTFWGAKNKKDSDEIIGTLYGLYYLKIEQGNTIYYRDYFFVINDDDESISNSNIDESIMHPIDTKPHYNFNLLKKSTTTDANNIWKNKVAGKTLNSQYYSTYYYTFELGGNIIANYYDDTETYYFWGAKDSKSAIYYQKLNVRDMLGNIAPNQEIWYYYGFSFDIRNSIFFKHDLSSSFYNSVENWYNNNLDKNGNLKPNADLNTYPLPERSYIDWNNPQEGKLIQK